VVARTAARGGVWGGAAQRGVAGCGGCGGVRRGAAGCGAADLRGEACVLRVAGRRLSRHVELREQLAEAHHARVVTRVRSGLPTAQGGYARPRYFARVIAAHGWRGEAGGVSLY
jgi:hypothetical protein